MIQTSHWAVLKAYICWSDAYPVISPAGLLSGIRLCEKNVKALLRDAHTLYESSSYGHATSLAIIAWEEITKEVVLSRNRLNPGAFEDSELKVVFKEHPFKIHFVLDWLRKFPEIVKGIPTDEEIDEATELLGEYRASCLYVDYKKSKWFDPNSPDLKDVAETLIAYGEQLAKTTGLVLRTIIPELKDS